MGSRYGSGPNEGLDVEMENPVGTAPECSIFRDALPAVCSYGQLSGFESGLPPGSGSISGLRGIRSGSKKPRGPAPHIISGGKHPPEQPIRWLREADGLELAMSWAAGGR
jgi:hypothetical protein